MKNNGKTLVMSKASVSVWRVVMRVVMAVAAALLGAFGARDAADED